MDQKTRHGNKSYQYEIRYDLLRTNRLNNEDSEPVRTNGGKRRKSKLQSKIGLNIALRSKNDERNKEMSMITDSQCYQLYVIRSVLSFTLQLQAPLHIFQGLIGNSI